VAVALLLPVELRPVNQTASTNTAILPTLAALYAAPGACPTIWLTMPNISDIDALAERVDRLLLRYEELQRTNALLTQQVEVITHERDSLKSRLAAARSRIDALLARLPAPEAAQGESS
jgi:cell division protein ZapB